MIITERHAEKPGQPKERITLQPNESFRPFPQVQLPTLLTSSMVRPADYVEYPAVMEKITPVAKFPFTIQEINGEIFCFGVRDNHPEHHRYVMPLGKVSQTISYNPPIKEDGKNPVTTEQLPLAIVVKLRATSLSDARTIEKLKLSLRIGNSKYAISWNNEIGDQYNNSEHSMVLQFNKNMPVIIVPRRLRNVLLPYDADRLKDIEATFGVVDVKSRLSKAVVKQGPTAYTPNNKFP